jgi:DNA-binding response OmpR family regulator
MLLVEDDERITESLAEALTDQHYVIDVATDGQVGWEFVEAFTYDLILLDVLLPKLDGISLCRHLRSHGHRTPVLLLTACDNTTDQVAGLDAGADDYVVKPYKLQELLARIRALLRRGNSPLLPNLEYQGLCFNPNAYEATYRNHPLPLTPKEYRLLELFLRRGHRLLNRSTILENLWSFEEPPEEDSVKALVKRLRQKLKLAGASSNLIETVYGLGYRLKQNP